MAVIPNSEVDCLECRMDQKTLDEESIVIASEVYAVGIPLLVKEWATKVAKRPHYPALKNRACKP